MFRFSRSELPGCQAGSGACLPWPLRAAESFLRKQSQCSNFAVMEGQTQAQSKLHTFKLKPKPKEHSRIKKMFLPVITSGLKIIRKTAKKYQPLWP